MARSYATKIFSGTLSAFLPGCVGNQRYRRQILPRITGKVIDKARPFCCIAYGAHRKVSKAGTPNVSREASQIRSSSYREPRAPGLGLGFSNCSVIWDVPLATDLTSSPNSHIVDDGV